MAGSGEKHTYFRKHDSAVKTGIDSVKIPAGAPSEFVVSVRETERVIRNLMRLRKTGVYAPIVASKTIATKTGRKINIDTSLN